MQTKTEQITASFALETQFDVVARSVEDQDEIAAASHDLDVRAPAPSLGQRFETRGVPTSPLND